MQQSDTALPFCHRCGRLCQEREGVGFVGHRVTIYTCRWHRAALTRWKRKLNGSKDA